MPPPPPRSTLFPYTRSSDLRVGTSSQQHSPHTHHGQHGRPLFKVRESRRHRHRSRLSRTLKSGDRKSTRLNSSHANISYAVFCLKKKKNTSPPHTAHH